MIEVDSWEEIGKAIDRDDPDALKMIVKRETRFGLRCEEIAVVAYHPEREPMHLEVVVCPHFGLRAATEYLEKKYKECYVNWTALTVHERLALFDREEEAMQAAEYPEHHWRRQP